MPCRAPKWLLALAALACQVPAHALELTLEPVARALRVDAPVTRPDQLPHSTVTVGRGPIRAAWLAAPTDRYAHAVLGDGLEAAQLRIESANGQTHVATLPATRVFEDLVPRLVALDGAGDDAVMVVESEAGAGAALTLWRFDGVALVRHAASDLIGQPNRWLNPLGAGDFDGDGQLDLAAVLTPHLGGVLTLYHITPPRLIPFARTGDVSTHRLGSTALGLGQVVRVGDRDALLVPDQHHRRLQLLRWDGQWQRLASVALPARIDGALQADGTDRWRLPLDDGRQFRLRLVRDRRM
ncbi:VCBS repeat-containing protein [Denitromonas sp.]|uniref:FG-GAP repeat domain-containing protein n=1 Tax=Denitromonas sp. TaxID=2734609 RepID=UPI002AFDF1FE|nr:VCBS repeat-containing protein [Denitromonas sp.]